MCQLQVSKNVWQLKQKHSTAIADPTLQLLSDSSYLLLVTN